MFYTDLPSSTGFGSSSRLSPSTANSLGAESMTPEGDMDLGMCSTEKRAGTTGTESPTRRNPRDPLKAQHSPGSTPGWMAVRGLLEWRQMGMPKRVHAEFRE